MALDPGQRKVVRRIKQIGAQVGATPKQVKAALETGVVESNLRNLPGGDADSAGWRQERASLYDDPTNLDASIRRFYAETAAVKDRYGRAGELAAAVQRPAAQYRGRYEGVSAQADALLGSSPRRATRSTAPSTPGDGAVASDQRAARGAAVATFLGDRNADPLDFALGIRAINSVSSPASGTTSRPAATSSPTSSPPATSGSGGSPSGMFRVSGPNPGRLKPALVTFADKVARVYGARITGSDGSGHSVRTATGGISQHSTGNATDIPASGRELLALGRAALIAAGMPRAQAMQQRGGLYNFPNGVQIIFNDTQKISGSAHADHLHISHG